jgi:putative flavoprotein involved in K+ transport
VRPCFVQYKRTFFSQIIVDMMIPNDKRHWGTVVIGGSQSGLATGYHLKKIGEDFIILEASDKIGCTWAKRWDSLKLFSPPSFNKLPGWSFPSSKGGPDTKDEMAAYLAGYAEKLDLPVNCGVKVTAVGRAGKCFSLTTSAGSLTADRVVVATGAHQFPYTPAFSNDLDTDVFQLHSDDYRNPGLLPSGDIVIVGSAISGIQIALELYKSRKIAVAGAPTYVIPRGLSQISQKLDWWLLQNILTIKTPMGRKIRTQFVKGGGAFHYLLQEMNESDIPRIGRIAGVKDGKLMLESGEKAEASVIIWCTGHRPDFSWIKENVTDEKGWPLTERGISSVDGLYFVGMPFQFGLTSSLVPGVGRDAGFISKDIEARRRSSRANPVYLSS